jgi:hypothetical protein
LKLGAADWINAQAVNSVPMKDFVMASNRYLTTSA